MCLCSCHLNTRAPSAQRPLVLRPTRLAAPRLQHPGPAVPPPHVEQRSNHHQRGPAAKCGPRRCVRRGSRQPEAWQAGGRAGERAGGQADGAAHHCWLAMGAAKPRATRGGAGRGWACTRARVHTRRRDGWFACSCALHVATPCTAGSKQKSVPVFQPCLCFRCRAGVLQGSQVPFISRCRAGVLPDLTDPGRGVALWPAQHGVRGCEVTASYFSQLSNTKSCPAARTTACKAHIPRLRALRGRHAHPAPVPPLPACAAVGFGDMSSIAGERDGGLCPLMIYW